MKNLFSISLTSFIFILTACGGDNEPDPVASLQETLATRMAEWGEYKTSLSGNYQMLYKNTGFTADGSQLFSDVRDGELSSAPNVTGTLTMDDLFQAALDVLEDPECSLVIRYFADKPVMEGYSRTCGSETFGILLDEFHEGNPLNP